MLVRVEGQVTNVDEESDFAYAAFVPPATMNRGFWVLEPREPKAPFRLLASDILFLVSSKGDWLACQCVPKNGSEWRGAFTLVNAPGVLYSGNLTNKGAAFQMDAIFVVPKGERVVHLVMLGAPAIELKIEDPAPR